ATLYALSEAAVRIASGYALTEDGLWRQHFWGVDTAAGRVLETTVRRVRYFGVVLGDGDEAVEVFLGNTHRSQFTPEADERIRRSSGGRMSAELIAEIREAA